MLNQETIERAILGEEESLNTVIQHYRPYIAKASREMVEHEDGRVEYQTNSELEGEIISHLLMAIMKLEGKNGTDTAKHK